MIVRSSIAPPLAWRRSGEALSRDRPRLRVRPAHLLRRSDRGVRTCGSPPVSHGDGDPLDICVLTDRPISRGEILLEARPIGGLRMVDRGEADDKILAVLLGDPTYGEINDVSQLARPIVDRLRHYFLTYKSAHNLTMRLYAPTSEALTGKWKPATDREIQRDGDAAAIVRTTL